MSAYDRAYYAAHREKINARNRVSPERRARSYAERGERFRGKANPNWKGEAATDPVKRKRARRLYALAGCERCPAPAVDHHHIDGDPGNNAPENVAGLCRRCHMAADGRLARVAHLRNDTALARLAALTPAEADTFDALVWAGLDALAPREVEEQKSLELPPA